jgi:hypothetical protein
LSLASTRMSEGTRTPVCSVTMSPGGMGGTTRAGDTEEEHGRSVSEKEV